LRTLRNETSAAYLIGIGKHGGIAMRKWIAAATVACAASAHARSDSPVNAIVESVVSNDADGGR